ncbi:hypothetical protein Saso_30500 [Streptomyces asoensis]|uniref:Uncharacterized protein n=1 Tax=Streptomyces asoensis TaxID=249586 RepID=A0ABQ3RZU7_9ACTN|nr:hypothetical protein GCM10010496_12090 [Streptomyces asoensis]GHI61400.1 hypothetical protein Saso_30500 [Streptomyces asoensis]
MAPIRAPARRCAPASAACSRLGFSAIMAAIGIQEPYERSSPKASATVPAMTTARISANRTSGRVSFFREVSPGSSEKGRL